MAGLGTIVNVIAIVAGGIVGMLLGKRFSKRFQDILLIINAVAVMFIGVGGTLVQMLRVGAGGALEMQGTMMMIASLSIGALIGEAINLDKHMETFGEWLKKKTGSSGDAGFVNGFVTASLTVSIGAMAVIGPIEDVLMHNYSILFTKAILDLIIVMVMAASMGKGCVFSAVPVGIFQGLMSLLAVFIQPVMTPAALSNISYIGNILIFCIGVNLFFGKKVKVANLLPALVVSVVCALI